MFSRRDTERAWIARAAAFIVLAAVASALAWTASSGFPDAGAATASVENGGCLPVDGGLMEYAERLATDPDPVMDETRAAYDITMVPLTEVEAVTDNQLCSKAGREYKKLLGLQGPTPDVYVVRIGNRYIAANHDIESPSEFTSYLVLDQQMNKVAAFAS